MKKFLGFLVALTFATVAYSQTSLNDKQIAKALITINEGEIDAAQIAERKAQSKEVKEFAKMMSAEHRNNIKETRSISKQEKMSPEKSDLSEQLKKDATTTKKQLKEVDKGAFDKTYMDSQVLMHEKALSALNDTFIPQAKSAALKTHLEKTKAAVSAHLDHAKQLQTQTK